MLLMDRLHKLKDCEETADFRAECELNDIKFKTFSTLPKSRGDLRELIGFMIRELLVSTICNLTLTSNCVKLKTNDGESYTNCDDLNTPGYESNDSVNNEVFKRLTRKKAALIRELEEKKVTSRTNSEVLMTVIQIAQFQNEIELAEERDRREKFKVKDIFPSTLLGYIPPLAVTAFQSLWDWLHILIEKAKFSDSHLYKVFLIVVRFVIFSIFFILIYAAVILCWVIVVVESAKLIGLW